MSMIFILIPINFDINIKYANIKTEKKVDGKKLIITASCIPAWSST
jgi:hypothetical protein